MSGAGNRIKGKNGELEIVKSLTSHGFKARRTGDSGQIDGDLQLDIPLYMEIRRRERVRLDAWMNEVVGEEAIVSSERRRKLPLLVSRISGGSWNASIRWDHMVAILESLDRRGILDEVIAEAMTDG